MPQSSETTTTIPERGRAKQKIGRHRTNRTDEHRALAADPVSEQSIDDLTASIGDEVPEQDRAMSDFVK